MEITQRLKEIVLNETNIDVNINSRKREVIEIRALYFKLLKEYNPFLTLEQIGNTVEKNHATVIHSLKKYNMYEKYNSDLKVLKSIIRNNIDDENIMYVNDNNTLKLEIKKLKNKNIIAEIEIDELKLKLKQKKYEYKIIENLNELMIQTTGTDKQELINIRLQAFYDMNKQR
jgi:hypothetical protein